MTDLDNIPDQFHYITQRDNFIDWLLSLHLENTTMKKHFTDWAKALDYKPTRADYERLGADFP